MPLPVPRLCFQSWLNSWDEHAPLPFFQDKAMRRAFLADVVEWGVSVTYDHLRLVQTQLYFDRSRTREQGFVGTCRFTAKSSKVGPRIAKSWPHWRPIAITLAPVERPRWAWD